ncbi:MAG: DNA double-strand break repair nuclease NurA [Promethearchaeota archaeon]
MHHYLEQQLQNMLLIINKVKKSAKDEIEEIRDLLPIQDFKLDLKKVLPFIAVDGSQTWLWSPMGINIWLMLNRIGMVHYRFENTKYKLIQKEVRDSIELISTLEEVVGSQSEIHLKLYEYVLEYAKGREHDVIAGSLMRLNEYKTALDYAKKYKNVIIALDGAFVSAFPEDLLSSLEFPLVSQIIEVCEKNNNILIGISKDSRKRSFSKNLSDESLLNYITMGEAKCFYIKIKSKSKDAKGDTYFVKLHPNATKWFRIDLGTNRDNPEEVFQIIAQYAKSQILLGYPFPLTEAHKVAVTIRQFRNIYEQILFDIGPVCGFNTGEILKGFTTMAGRKRGEFHESLDLVSRISR